MSKTILFVGICLSVLIRAFFIFYSQHTADVKLLYLMGESLIKGENPYLALKFNVYPPLAVYLEAFTVYLSNIFNVPFHILTRIWPNLADILIALMLYKFLLKLRVKPVAASCWALVFLLNPISIIISAAHGQLDSISSLLLVSAIYLISFYSIKSKVFIGSAALIGLSITIKPTPAMLLPIFLLHQKIELKRAFLFLVVAAIPLAVTLAPFVSGHFSTIVGGLLGYSGVYDFGYTAIIRGLFYQDNAVFWLPFSNELLDASKTTFILGLIFILTLFIRSKDLVKGILAIYLLFLSFYFGISAQYLCWVLPLAVIKKEKILIVFSIAGLLALIGFYLFFGPDILFGRLVSVLPYQSKFMLVYFVGNLVFWLVALFWLVKILYKQFLEVSSSASFNHKRMIRASLLLFILSLIPSIRLIKLTFEQLTR